MSGTDVLSAGESAGKFASNVATDSIKSTGSLVEQEAGAELLGVRETLHTILGGVTKGVKTVVTKTVSTPIKMLTSKGRKELVNQVKSLTGKKNIDPDTEAQGQRIEEEAQKMKKEDAGGAESGSSGADEASKGAKASTSLREREGLENEDKADDGKVDGEREKIGESDEIGTTGEEAGRGAMRAVRGLTEIFEGDMPSISRCRPYCSIMPELSECSPCFMTLPEIERSLTRVNTSLMYMPCPKQCSSSDNSGLCSLFMSCHK